MTVSDGDWIPLGAFDGDFADPAASGDGASLQRFAGRDGDRPARWLTTAMVALGLLAGASAVVSYAAQYRMVLTAKDVAPIAGLEAGIPDVAALVFATLGIALALHGRRAIRARVLNVGAVGTSVAMNVLAAGHGWRDLVIWAMPPIAYALASDTTIGVVRAWTIARQKALKEALDNAEPTPLAIVGGFLLWALRLVLAPASTLSGFRRWVLDECPVAPGRRAVSTTSQPATAVAQKARAAIDGSSAPGQPCSGPRAGTKTGRFLALVVGRYGPLAEFPLSDVSRVCSELAPEADLDLGAARTALRRHVLAARNGSAS